MNLKHTYSSPVILRFILTYVAVYISSDTNNMRFTQTKHIISKPSTTMALAFRSPTSIGFSSSTLSHNEQVVKLNGNNFQPLDRSQMVLLASLNVSKKVSSDTIKALNARNDSIVPSASTTFVPDLMEQ